MASQHEIEQWLQEGIIAAKAGRYDQARFRLLDVVQENQTNETAWYWLYHLFNNHEDRRTCLENLITINPHNDWAHRELLKYLAQPASIPANHATYGPTAAEALPSSRRKRRGQAVSGPRPIVLKLMIAFWVGISTTFLGGGIIAIGEWFIASMRSRSFPNYVTVFEALQLLTAMGFVVVGVTGLIVAVLLFYRSMVGFYGSILLGLGLLLMGPTVSLIVTPTNYVTLVCTGGISGMIVLLTLASQPAFERK